MRMPCISLSATTLLKQYGLYHSTRLHADASLTAMAEAWDAAQAGLAAKVDALEAAQAAAMTAMAARDGEEEALAGAVRSFYGTLVKKTHNDRKSPFFTVYFPDGVAAVVGAPMEAEIQRAQVIAGKLAQETEADLKAHLQPLTAAIRRLTSAVEAYRRALAAQLQASGLVEQEKVAWLDAYKLDHRTLAHSFYKSPRKADSYFKPSVRAAKTKTPAPAAPSAPALKPAVPQAATA